MSKLSRFGVSLLLTLSLVVTACASKPPAPTTPPTNTPPSGADIKLEPIKIKISYSAYSAVMAPLWLASEEGIWKKHGLDVELLYIEGGAKSIQGLLSDEVHIALTGVDALVNAKLKGADVEAVTGCFDGYFFQVWGKKGITKMSDLKGKVIAASQAGSASEYGAKAAIKASGLAPADVKITYIGSTAARVAGLEQGIVDAAVISPPDGLKAKAAGFAELMNLIDTGLPGGYCTMNARKSWVDGNREAVRRFAKAYVEAIAIAKQDKALAQKYIGKYTNTTEQDLLDESYRLAIPPIKKLPYPSVEVFKAALANATAPEAKTATPESFFDTSFIKELDDSGFITKLYK